MDGNERIRSFMTDKHSLLIVKIIYVNSVSLGRNHGKNDSWAKISRQIYLGTMLI